MVKEKYLEDERLLLVQKQNKLNEQQNILEGLKDRYLKTKQVIDNIKIDEGMNVVLLDSYANYINKITKDIVSQKEIVEKANQELNLQKFKTKEAYIKVKTLEKLKDKQKENYNLEFAREEFKLIDDIVNSRRVAI